MLMHDDAIKALLAGPVFYAFSDAVHQYWKCPGYDISGWPKGRAFPLVRDVQDPDAFVFNGGAARMHATELEAWRSVFSECDDEASFHCGDRVETWRHRAEVARTNIERLLREVVG